MKNSIVAFCLLLFACPAAAQGIGDSLIVNLKSGQRVAIPLADIEKITFDSLTASSVTPTPFQGGVIAHDEGVVNFPNPLRTSTTIEFELPEPGSASIAIYDVKGNLIRTLDAPSRDAGLNRITWDGLDAGGAPVPTGDYFYEVRLNDRSSSEAQTRKMVVIK